MSNNNKIIKFKTKINVLRSDSFKEFLKNGNNSLLPEMNANKKCNGFEFELIEGMPSQRRQSLNQLYNDIKSLDNFIKQYRINGHSIDNKSLTNSTSNESLSSNCFHKLSPKSMITLNNWLNPFSYSKSVWNTKGLELRSQELPKTPQKVFNKRIIRINYKRKVNQKFNKNKTKTKFKPKNKIWKKAKNCLKTSFH
jgi:hypothetical protein